MLDENSPVMESGEKQDEGPDINIDRLMVNNQIKTEWKRSTPLKTYSKKSPPTPTSGDGKSRYGRSHKPKLSGDFLSTDKKVSHYLKIEADNQMHYFKQSPYALKKDVKPSPKGVKRGRGRPPKTDKSPMTSPKLMSPVKPEKRRLPIKASDLQAPVPTSTHTLPLPTELMGLKEEINFSDTESVVEDADWNCGDLAWANIGGFPFWPCTLTKDPFENVYKKSKITGKGRQSRLFLHVRFFGDKGRRSWVQSNRVMPFQGLDAFQALVYEICTPETKKRDFRMYKAFLVTGQIRKSWQAAVSEAESLMESPRSERILYFHNLYPPTPPPSVIAYLENNTFQTDMGGLVKVDREQGVEGADGGASPTKKKRGRKKKVIVEDGDWEPPRKKSRRESESGLPSEQSLIPVHNIKVEVQSPNNNNSELIKEAEEPIISRRKRSVGAKSEDSSSGEIESPVTTPNVKRKSSMGKRIPTGPGGGVIVSAQEQDAFNSYRERLLVQFEDHNPRLSREEAERYLRRTWAEMNQAQKARYFNRTRTAEELENDVKESNSEGHSGETSRSQSPHAAAPTAVKLQPKKPKIVASLFTGVKADKVCQVCFKGGDILKCRGPCCSHYHADCAQGSNGKGNQKEETVPLPEETPPLKKRGRKPKPKKTAPPATAVPSTAVTTPTVAPIATATSPSTSTSPRKRGRPRKYALTPETPPKQMIPLTQATPTTPSDSSGTPKRGRGRPRKYPLPSPVVIKTEIIEEEEEEVKETAIEDESFDPLRNEPGDQPLTVDLTQVTEVDQPSNEIEEMSLSLPLDDYTENSEQDTETEFVTLQLDDDNIEDITVIEAVIESDDKMDNVVIITQDDTEETQNEKSLEKVEEDGGEKLIEEAGEKANETEESGKKIAEVTEEKTSEEELREQTGDEEKEETVDDKSEQKNKEKEETVDDKSEQKNKEKEETVDEKSEQKNKEKEETVDEKSEQKNKEPTKDEEKEEESNSGKTNEKINEKEEMKNEENGSKSNSDITELKENEPEELETAKDTSNEGNIEENKEGEKQETKNNVEIEKPDIGVREDEECGSEEDGKGSVEEENVKIEKKIKKSEVKDDVETSSKSSDTDIDSKGKKGWMCKMCSEGKEGPCFICGQNGDEPRMRCSINYCGKMYHTTCVREWPQTQLTQGAKGRLVLHCPQHACHTCISDNPSAITARFTNDKLVRCVKCPTSYHYGNYCIPAGSDILSSSQILCPKHYIPKKKGIHHVNAAWCFICAMGGSLICCDLCPTSFHAECLNISTPEGSYICEDCETGRYPLYGEIVWVKLGAYRWWPAKILFPSEVPSNIRSLEHTNGEFAVKFFGSYDYYWVNRGRVFLYHEGDGGKVSTSKSRVDEAFLRGIEEASSEFIRCMEERATREATSRPTLKPPKYVKIQSNKMIGTIRNLELDSSTMTPCDCTPTQEDPCGPDSDCLNRLLMLECNPQVCPAGEKCKNQNFEKRRYPALTPFRTESRGWGLKTLVDVKKGEFVIEYVGEMIDEAEYKRRLTEMQKNKDENYYFLTIDKDRMLDAGPKGNMARFMNHSCDPNCETQKWTVNGDTRVGLFALKDIKQGSELVFNYNLETIGNSKVQCKCGAPNCAGFIGAKQPKPSITDEEKKKAMKKKRAKKNKPKAGAQENTTGKITEDKCFTCEEGGELLLCDHPSCPKAYHLSCLGLTKHPAGGWVCPWHQCSICSASSDVQRCSLCINSYCIEHAEGNIAVHKNHGRICFNHNMSDSGSDWSEKLGSSEEEIKPVKKRRSSVGSRNSGVLLNGHLTGLLQ